MNSQLIIEAAAYLDDAILKIDTLLRKYRFVTTIRLAKDARLGLERASRLINAGINGDVKTSEPGTKNEKSNNVDNGNINIDEGNDSVSESAEESSNSNKQGDESNE